MYKLTVSLKQENRKVAKLYLKSCVSLLVFFKSLILKTTKKLVNKENVSVAEMTNT